MLTTNHIATEPDYAAIKTKQNAAWGSGDYARIGTDRKSTRLNSSH